MNLKEKLAEAQKRLAEIKAAVENGEKGAEELEAAIEGVKTAQANLDAAEQAEKMLKSLGGKKDEKADQEGKKKEYTSIGDFAAKNLDLSDIVAGKAKSAGTGYGFKARTDAHTAPSVITTDNRVVDLVDELTLRSLFGAESISGNALTYFQLQATEGTAAVTAEGATKPQIHVPSTPVTVPLAKIAGWFWETDELLNDAPFLKSAIDNRGMYELRRAVETYLATTLLGTSGIQTQAIAGQALNADDIFKGITKVQSATGYAADAIVINPADYETLRLAKDSNLQYYGGGYFYAPYGNGAVAGQPGLWGRNTVITTAVAQGTVLVGAFKAGASVIGKAGEGASIEVFRGDHDDAINNRVTVVVEERLALAVRIPSAFVKIS